MLRSVSLFAITVTLISGCGMSLEEKERIAKVTCSIIGETRNMDSAIRVEKVNEVRDQIGEEPFLDGDYAIKESLENGVCPELILNDANYKTLLSKRRTDRLERERIAREKSRKREKELRRQEELERKKKIAEAERKRKQDQETLLDSVRNQTGRFLLDCSEDLAGYLLVDLNNKRIKRSRYEKLSLTDSIEDSTYTRLTIKEITNKSVLLGRIEIKNTWDLVDGKKVEGKFYREVPVTDKLEMYSYGGHVWYTKLAQNGGYMNGMLDKGCSFEWSP